MEDSKEFITYHLYCDDCMMEFESYTKDLQVCPDCGSIEIEVMYINKEGE